MVAPSTLFDKRQVFENMMAEMSGIVKGADHKFMDALYSAMNYVTKDFDKFAEQSELFKSYFLMMASIGYMALDIRLIDHESKLV